MKVKVIPTTYSYLMKKVIFRVKNEENIFAKRKIITFYSRMEKHKILEKKKNFYNTPLEPLLSNKIISNEKITIVEGDNIIKNNIVIIS